VAREHPGAGPLADEPVQPVAPVELRTQIPDWKRGVHGGEG
jgi:hypothetical protein